MQVDRTYYLPRVEGLIKQLELIRDYGTTSEINGVVSEFLGVTYAIQTVEPSSYIETVQMAIWNSGWDGSQFISPPILTTLISELKNSTSMATYMSSTPKQIIQADMIFYIPAVTELVNGARLTKNLPELQTLVEAFEKKVQTTKTKLGSTHFLDQVNEKLKMVGPTYIDLYVAIMEMNYL